MDLIIHSKKIKGNINIPSSKSVSHRAIVCACLAKKQSIIENVNMCEDVKNTINIMREIVPIKINQNTLIIDGGIPHEKEREITVYESATTLRILLPVLSFYTEKLIINTGEKLYKRGIKEIEKLYAENNKKILKKENKFIVKKLPINNVYNVDCRNSSQTASGMLIISPYLGQKTRIITKGNASKSYIDLTIKTMALFGVKIEQKNDNLVIDNQEYKATNICVPIDASFKLNIDVINALGSNIKIQNNTQEQAGPDSVLSKQIYENKLLTKKTVNLSNNPDSIFALTLYFLFNRKSVKFTNINRLENKESKRLTETKKLINLFGGSFTKANNSITINPPSSFENKKVILNSNNDHRLVFAGLIISAFIKKHIIIKEYECAAKSTPNFIQILDKLNLNYKITEEKEETYKIKGTNEEIKINYTKNTNKTLKQYIKKNQKVIIVTDENTPKEFLDENKQNTLYFVDESGEKAKQLAEVEKLTKFLLKNNISKSDLLVAYGGGTITDLVGFVASTYKRGICHINIPTTLIGQVDASIGGKTAINVEEAKNQIGTFNLPLTTIINTNLLKTLPEKELQSGMAEIIKIAATSNPKLFYSIYDSKPYEKLEEWIREAVKTKAQIVAEDYLENSKRKNLNFGHTYGHALELKEKLTHGEAIAKGMMIVSPLKPLNDVLMSYKFALPTTEDENKAQDLLKQDKKIKNNKLSIVKLEKIGKTKIEEIDIWFLMAKKQCWKLSAVLTAKKQH